jgi:hypothetical protein
MDDCRCLHNVRIFPPLLTASHFRLQFHNRFPENHKSDIINPVSYSAVFFRPLRATASPTRKKGGSSNSQVYNRQKVATLPAVNKSCFFLQEYAFTFASYVCSVGPVVQSVERLATGWTVRGSNPGGEARFSAPVQTGPGAHPASCTMGTGSFPRQRTAGA